MGIDSSDSFVAALRERGPEVKDRGHRTSGPASRGFSFALCRSVLGFLCVLLFQKWSQMPQHSDAPALTKSPEYSRMLSVRGNGIDRA